MFWHVYNSLNGEQRVIESHHLAGFLTSLHEDQLPYIFLWQEGWSNWKAFLETPELLVMRKKVPPLPPRGLRATTNVADQVLQVSVASKPSPVPAPSPELSLEETPLVPVTISFASTKPQKPAKPPPGAKPEERRRSKRTVASLNVIISADGAVFRTLSVDISEVGLRLENPVPASMLKKQVQIVVSSPDLKTKLRFNAQLVGDASDAKRFTFVEPPATQVEQIKAWLSELADPAKNSA